MEIKYRDWWLTIPTNAVTPIVGVDSSRGEVVLVIEKSAYDALKAECERLKAELAELKIEKEIYEKDCKYIHGIDQDQLANLHADLTEQKRLTRHHFELQMASENDLSLLKMFTKKLIDALKSTQCPMTSPYDGLIFQVEAAYESLKGNK